MSREFKYRVKTTWCDEVRIAEVTDMQFGKWAEGAVIGVGFFWLSSYSAEYVDFDTSTGDVLMQYTGLKDKNGVEIYEGDILSLGDTASIAQVVWDDFKFKLKWVNPIGASDKIYAWKDDLEVIGNIYEKPELLEVRNYQK